MLLDMNFWLKMYLNCESEYIIDFCCSVYLMRETKRSFFKITEELKLEVRN